MLKLHGWDAGPTVALPISTWRFSIARFVGYHWRSAINNRHVLTRSLPLPVLASASLSQRRILSRMSPQPHFTPELFVFLRKLKRNNNREWFQRHKPEYEHSVRDPFLRFISDLQPQLQRLSPYLIADPKPSGGSLLRIYKDLRFRPDAPPYQTMAAARFPHSAWKKTVAPGFYLHLEPKRSFFAGGLWRPDPETRARVREAILRDASRWKKATRSKAFKTNCELSGELLKRLPSGVDANHPLAEDLRKKDFIMFASFTEAQVCAPDFLNRIVTICRVSGPFMEFLTRALGLPWAKGEKSLVRDIAQIDSFEIV